MSKFKELKNKIKEDQKERAHIIRFKKSCRKPAIYEANKEKFDSMPSWYSTYWGFRHTHIAYCMFFNGTLYDDIERPSDDNMPNMKSVESYIDEWKTILNTKEDGDETICLDS